MARKSNSAKSADSNPAPEEVTEVIEVIEEAEVEKVDAPVPSIELKIEKHSTEILGFKVEVSRGGNNPRWRTRVDGLFLCYDSSLGELRREADEDIKDDERLTVPEFASVRTAILQGVDYICDIAKAQGLLKIQALRAIGLY